MTCITLSLLDKVDERLRKRLEENKTLLDYFLDEEFMPGKTKSGILIATTEKKAAYEGIKPLRMDVQERQSEDLLALICEADADYSLPAYRAYADPFNTPSLYEDSRISDGFIIKAGGIYDSPKDNHRILHAIKEGDRISSIYRRSGEYAAAMDSRIFVARYGPLHLKMEEVLKPFTDKPKKNEDEGEKTAKNLHVLPLNIRNGKITVDNTYKPKTIKLWAKTASTQAPQ